jgi:thiamine pyrophosphate-dependent acetolactate synthase large subunit-like protein
VQTFIANKALTYVHASNESSSLYMAAYEALSLNKVGITFSTAGPGSLMAMTGIGTALYEAVPLISFFGIPVVDFQYIDKSVFEKICKRVYYINESTVDPHTVIGDAFTIAQRGTPESPGKGPVVICILDSCWMKPYTYKRSPSTLTYPRTNSDAFRNGILSNITAKSKVLIRLGERVHPTVVRQVADLSTVYKNVFITLTLLSKTYLDPTVYPNVGVDGPLNNAMNPVLNAATMVLDVGDGINYGLVLYTDVYPYMTPNTPLFYVLNSKTQYPPASSTTENTLYMEVNEFLTDFIAAYKPPLPRRRWRDARPLETAYAASMLAAYKAQRVQSTWTTIAVVAHCFEVIYQEQAQSMVIDDNLLYSTDVGLVSFLTNSFLRVKTPMAISILGEFSAIGSSISVVAGYLRTSKYKGAVLVLGDGGFLNVASYLIDLCKVLQENPEYTVLILLMNDNCYTNVAQAEAQLFGSFTSITSTAPLQQGVNLGEIACAYFGDKLADYLELTELQENSDELIAFMRQWYRTRPGGASILHYRTAVGQPYKITL